MSVLRFGRLIKSQSEVLYIKRGDVGNYKVAVDSDGNARSFRGIIGTRDRSIQTTYTEYYSTNTPIHHVLFTMNVNPITFDGDTESTILGKDDKIVRLSQMDRTPAKPSETAAQNLKRDIQDTTSGVLVIETEFDNFGRQIYQTTDIDSLGR